MHVFPYDTKLLLHSFHYYTRADTLFEDTHPEERWIFMQYVLEDKGAYFVCKVF